MNQTDTPRTDDVLAHDWRRTSYTKAGELTKLSHTLERELAASRAECLRLREALTAVTEAFTRSVGNADEKHHSLTIASAALQEVTP